MLNLQRRDSRGLRHSDLLEFLHRGLKVVDQLMFTDVVVLVLCKVRCYNVTICCVLARGLVYDPRQILCFRSRVYQ